MADLLKGEVVTRAGRGVGAKIAKLAAKGRRERLAQRLGRQRRRRGQRYRFRANCIAPFAWTRLVGTTPNDPKNAARILSVQDPV